MLEKVFLSYTYRPHPDHAQALNVLESAARRLIECMGSRVIDGVDLGGQGLTPALEKRIQGTDALVALITPQADQNGAVVRPGFVESEFNFARASLRTIAILHSAFAPAGLGAQDEYIPHTEGEELETILKLAATLRIWHQDMGESLTVRVEPSDVARRFDQDLGHNCEYRTRTGPEETRWIRTSIWPEAGGAFVFIPNVREDSLVRVRVNIDGERWQSVYASPQMSGIKLEQQQ